MPSPFLFSMPSRGRTRPFKTAGAADTAIVHSQL